jgi:hypothetical protein
MDEDYDSESFFNEDGSVKNVLNSEKIEKEDSIDEWESSQKYMEKKKATEIVECEEDSTKSVEDMNIDEYIDYYVAKKIEDWTDKNKEESEEF